MAAKPEKAAPSWSDVKARLAEFDRAGLLGWCRTSMPNFLLCNTIKPLKYQDSLSKIGKIVAM
jgi:hypothetical protein